MSRSDPVGVSVAVTMVELQQAPLETGIGRGGRVARGRVTMGVGVGKGTLGLVRNSNSQCPQLVAKLGVA